MSVQTEWLEKDYYDLLGGAGHDGGRRGDLYVTVRSAGTRSRRSPHRGV